MIRAEPEPFECVPHWLLFSGVSGNAVRLYLVLKKYASKEGVCWPSRRSLAAHLGVSVNTLDRVKDELVDVRAICFTVRKTDAGDYSSNEYHVHWSEGGCSNLGLGVVQNLGIGIPTGGGTGSPKIDTRTYTHIELTPTELSFDAFWAAYPLHIGKQAARKAWDKAVKTTTAETIIAGAARYAADPNRDPRYTAHASTWLNAGRWDDEPLPSSGKVSGSVLFAQIASS